MAESKAPAAAWSAARLPFCSQRCVAGTPGVGAANTALSAALGAGAASSGGSSKSCEYARQTS
jgi:hypothetical protein